MSSLLNVRGLTKSFVMHAQGGLALSVLRDVSLAVTSGRIAKQTPEAMTVRTPSAVLGVRGTEFVVNAQ